MQIVKLPFGMTWLIQLLCDRHKTGQDRTNIPGIVLSIKQAENPAINAGFARNIGIMLSRADTPANLI